MLRSILLHRYTIVCLSIHLLKVYEYIPVFITNMSALSICVYVFEQVFSFILGKFLVAMVSICLSFKGIVNLAGLFWLGQSF